MTALPKEAPAPREIPWWAIYLIRRLAFTGGFWIGYKLTEWFLEREQPRPRGRGRHRFGDPVVPAGRELISLQEPCDCWCHRPDERIGGE